MDDDAVDLLKVPEPDDLGLHLPPDDLVQFNGRSQSFQGTLQPATISLAQTDTEPTH